MKKLFALLTLILTAATLARSGRDGERAYLYDPLPVILPEGINHLLDNSQSELEEMKGFDRVVERFMQRWEITGASIAVMKNGRLLYSKATAGPTRNGTCAPTSSTFSASPRCRS